jgi:hypothetical protein
MGVLTEDNEEICVDIIVLATGFRASAGGFVPKSDFGHAVSKILRKKIKMRNQEKNS